jgi:2-polyprenyl-3-methyl-5-hydroxy-6-metoxy-1,4-benzoquinol methylase
MCGFKLKTNWISLPLIDSWQLSDRLQLARRLFQPHRRPGIHEHLGTIRKRVILSAYSEFVVDLQNENSSWRKVFDLVTANSQVLDVGCNSGYFAKVLIEQKGCHVDGVEIDRDDAQRARAICSTVFEGDVEDSSFALYKARQSYDFVVCLDIIEHLRNPTLAVQRFAELLKPDGRLIFSIPNMANGSVRLGLLQGLFDYQREGLLDETHLHFYTLKAICKLVEESGLSWHGLTQTVYDVMPETIGLCLGTVGLTPTTQFVDFLNSGESVVFQYIGVLGRNPPASAFNPSNVVAGIEPASYNADLLASVQSEARQVFTNMVAVAEEDSRKAAYIVQLEQSIADAAQTAALSLAAKSQVDVDLATCRHELLQAKQQISSKTFAGRVQRLSSFLRRSSKG